MVVYTVPFTPSQERLEQQRHSSSNSSAPSSNASSEISHPKAQLPDADVKTTTSDSQPSSVERKINSSPENPRATKNQAPNAVDPDLHRKICEHGPCNVPAPQPIPVKPSAPEASTKLCKDGPCQQCPAGQSRAKDGSCGSGTSAKTVAPPPGSRPVIQQSCAAGQVWNGTQCQLAGARPCTGGQNMTGASCQTDCTIATGSAQNVIAELRSARQQKDEACLQNPTGKECQAAEASYDLTLNEYRNFLGGVPIECRTVLPDPIAI
jgi:hypothetical protein